MNYFIFRNNTIENIFGNYDADYSGYENVSHIPKECNTYIWFYQVPLKFDTKALSKEIEIYIDKFRFVHNKIESNKTILAFTLSNLFSLNFSNDDFSVKMAINRFNSDLITLSHKFSNIKVLDIEEFFGRYEIKSLIDWKYFFIAQIGINPKLAAAFRKWFDRCLEEIEMKRKKCLVLDLDNTIWGGILGEDGIEGIKIGGDYPGKAFLYFQKSLIELSKNGVLLTICSKNNENDVLEAWEKNPFIVLKQQYISAYRINWQNKADNIGELSEELNIGLDSFVFVDDNPSERELVKQLLPMIEVPDFPPQPYELPVFFQSLVNKYFRIYSNTNEDKRKTVQYKANAERAKEKHKFTDLGEYLKSLDICIEIIRANDFNIPRIAQMTQKTNQFNLTTKRYTDANIIGFVQKGWVIYCISVSDKFGDNGITGTIIVEKAGNTAKIDTLLLSCRILGKGIENAFVNTALNLLKNQGIEIVVATYIPTAKNSQVAEFYDKLGFELVHESNIKEYSLSLSGKDLKIKRYYNIKIK